MVVVALVNGASLIIVAWIGLRQERVRRELERFNGSVDKQLKSIHQNLIDNPGPPAHPPSGPLRDLPATPNVKSSADPPEAA